MSGRRLLRGVCALVLLLGFLGCDTNDGGEITASTVLDAGVGLIDAAGATGSTIARPPGWDELSHGADAAVDYARVFPNDGVQRIDIRIAPEQRQAMLDDLEKLLGKEGAGGMGGIGGMSALGGGLPEAGFTACSGLANGAACTFNGAGRCSMFGPDTKPFCIPNSFAMPGGAGAAGPGGGGAIDLVKGDPVTVPVTIEYQGRTWTKVSMRYKGNSSLSGSWRAGVRKIGFRLDFDKFEDDFPEIKNQRFFGFGKLTFSSGYSDPALIRDKLAAELLRDFGLPTARCAFYRVFVDAGQGPEYWGLYTMIEDPSDRLIDAQFADGSGNLYKPDGVGADFTRFDQSGFEKKSNEKAADYGDVMAAIEALHAPRDDAAGWRERLEKTLDVDTFLATLAIGRAIGHWDSYGVMSHNYYLYGDPSQQGRLVWISWDHNMTWLGGSGPFGGGSIMMDETTERWPLIRFLLDDPSYRARYRAHLERALGGSYRKAAFDARAAALYEQVAPHVLGTASEPGERAPYTQLRSVEAFQSALTDTKTGLLTMADTKRSEVSQALLAPVDRPATGPSATQPAALPAP